METSVVGTPAVAAGATPSTVVAASATVAPPAAAVAPAVSAPAAGAAAAIAAPSAAAPADPVGDLVDRLDDAQPAVEIPREPTLVLPPPPPDNLWDRIRRGFKMPDLETKLAQNRTQWYASQTDYLDRMAQRSRRYLFHIVEEIERRGMPTELALLPFVESAFQPEAISSAKAAGLWQFIPSTGKTYELTQNAWQDERRDVVESTRAALDYLQNLYDMFGDWHLALAAYNWGEGAVTKAIARNRRAHKPTGYTSLRMPRETAYYVPKLQAIKNIVSEPERYGVALPRIDDAPYFIAIHGTRDIDVNTAARLAEMDPDEFRALNPAINRPVIVAAAGTKVLLPAENVERFHANLAAWEATGQPLSSWTAYKMEPDETLAAIAKRAGISEEQLRDANQVPPRYRLAPGSTILIPRDETMGEDISPESVEARFAVVPESANLRKITYRVRRGDTLHRVARRWKVDEQDIIVWNHLTAPTLFAGQRLELTVPYAKGRSGKSNVAKRGRSNSAKKTSTSAKAPAKSSAKAPSKVSTAAR
jgi:membrane-bound lytic murein transglycosylase D